MICSSVVGVVLVVLRGQRDRDSYDVFIRSANPFSFLRDRDVTTAHVICVIIHVTYIPGFMGSSLLT